MVQPDWARKHPIISDFRKIFIHRFARIKKQPLTILSTFCMRHQEQENLCSYIHRFNSKVVEDPSATPDLLVRNFIQGLWPGDLFNSLVKKSPTNFKNFLAKSKNTLTWRRHRHLEWKSPIELSGHIGNLDNTISHIDLPKPTQPLCMENLLRVLHWKWMSPSKSARKDILSRGHDEVIKVPKESLRIGIVTSVKAMDILRMNADIRLKILRDSFNKTRTWKPFWHV